MISVIIPTYKEPEVLDLCLHSATEGQINKNQIIVVVDGYYDLNKEILEKYKDKIDILDLGENQGLCRATNLGVYNTQHDKILIVNDDNVFPYGWDDTLESIYTPNSVITPNQIEPTPSMFRQFHIKDLGRDPKTFDLKAFWKYEIEEIDEKIEETGSTLPIFMNKIDYIRVGGWDEYYENGIVGDWDFFLKCNLSGLKMLRTYTCHFYHFSSLSVNGIKRQQAEKKGHEYAVYKWGTNIKHNINNNLKYL